MATLKERILDLVSKESSLTDREIADSLQPGEGQQAVNQAARALRDHGRLIREVREDGKIGNYLVGTVPPDRTAPTEERGADGLSEDEVKRTLKVWLESSGWTVAVAWRREHGIDVEAKRNGQRWIIEAKGCGSLPPMRVNYFLMTLGELLQRMGDPAARYSIALPDMKQFRSLWQRLPDLAKSRTTISALFVNGEGQVEEVVSRTGANV